jgi:tetratricopeptide (TPR) repeat protein
MSDRQHVEFVGEAAVVVPEPLRGLVGQELETVFSNHAARAITVSRCYAGYSSPSMKKLVLGVEVRLAAGSETHIVKLGSAETVARDFDGWQECIRGRDFASRIFLPVRRHDLPGGRVAVLYRDAYTLFGPDRARSTPESLETVITWSVLDDHPTPTSVERAIAHIYTDLARWLYYSAVEGDSSARAFYGKRLARSLPNWSPDTAEAGQEGEAQRRQELRQDAIWLTCGGARHDSDEPLEYLDPYDYVAWALSSGSVPPTLIGRSHGDLHGRNVLLGVQRGEAEYPAVFDYGETGCQNVLAWDFVKPETELKVRLLPILYRDDASRRALLETDRRVRRGSWADSDKDTVNDRARRRDRLEFAFRFERLLAERTAWIEGRVEAESREPPGGRDLTGAQKLDRLLAILLRFRQEAALWLGYDHGRQHRWQDEYYFALGAYGLVHARSDWDYEPRQAECALISAGVALARMQGARNVIRDMILADRADCTMYPSYRVPLALVHRRWKGGKNEEALAILNQVLAGRPLTDATRSSFHHAVPLLAEQALVLADRGEYRSAESVLRPVREGCQLFADAETLCRIGRAFKESGDRKWQNNPVSLREATNFPAVQMYRHALAAYGQAFAIAGDYYAGINAASLAALVGLHDQAKDIARQVARACEAKHEGLVGEEAVWVYATEGEAALLLGNRSAPVFYASALEDIDPTARQVAQTMYNQLCRLWHALGPDAVEPVIRKFEQCPLWPRLDPGPLGDCEGRRRNESHSQLG